ncbi:hypothetical protein TRFO_15657 [Tritrichomonas foetus]|uniref:Ras-GAP domain-containing protein n=1 Tax=Tritrichomonas foetus TaxID=1144522 RepID=A0A1J4KW83_9EUKA|nr:hypothetical protein TRFO_15657 [Tritrichomonas foetus]|eukprot:OHT14012.1 hypothetical protein TRFO_15657 [Tritrichomonas foetus]
MSLAEDQILQLIKSLNDIIQKHPISKNEAIDTKQITPEKYLKIYFHKNMALLKSLSVSRIQIALLTILNETSQILKSLNPKDLKFIDINRLCIFYVVAAKCVNAYKEAGDVADNAVFDLLIQQSRDVLSSNEFGTYTRFIQHNFALLLSAIGAHSSSAYEKIFSKLRDDFTTSKIQQATLRLCMYMPSKVSLINDVFKQIVTFITRIPHKFYDPFCQMLTETIIMAFKRDVASFIAFLDRAEDISFAHTVQDTIVKWDKKGDHHGYSSLLVLEILMPSKLKIVSNIGIDENGVIAKLTRFYKKRGAKRDTALKALFTGYRAYALSNSHELIGNLMSRYYNDFMKYYLTNHKEFKNNDLAPYAFVDFPLCVLFKSPFDFREKILPILNKPGMWIYIAKIVRRACKQMSPFDPNDNNRKSNDNNVRFDLSSFDVLIEPTMILFKKALPEDIKNMIEVQKAQPCIPKIFSGFGYCPLFFRMLAYKDISYLEIIFNNIKNDSTLSPQYAFLRFFDQKYADQSKIDNKLLDIYAVTTKFMLEFYSQISLYQSSHFADSIPDIIFTITESLFSLFSGNTSIEDTSIIKNTLPIISLLETSAVMFLASSKEEIRTKGAKMISILLEVYHTFLEIVRNPDFFGDFQFPVEEYQIIESRHNKKLTLACPAIKNTLRSIEQPSQAHLNAYKSLFTYFLALTKALDPTVELIEEPKSTVNLPPSILSDEWIGTFSVMLTILTEDVFLPIMNQLKYLLRSTGDLGAITAAAVPTAMTPRFFFAMINLAVNWVAYMQNVPQGFVDASSEHSVFINNIMHMIRGLAEQKQWTIYEPKVFGHLLRKVVSHSDMIPGEDFRLSCAQLVISVLKLLKSRNTNLEPMTRHSISKSLLGWLPTVATLSRQYTSTIHQCLALLLDDLSLLECVDPNDPKSPEEKADAQFMLYFAAIKNRLDMKETSATDMVPVLAALLNKNLSIGIEHCISMGFDDKDTVRAAFIAAVAAVFRVPEAKVADTSLMSNDTNLIDAIFNGNWEFVEFICSCVPYSRAEAFGAAMVEASVIKNIEYEYLDRMILMEVKTVDEGSRNTLFRGNAVPARAVGHFPRIVGTQWMTDTLRPVFEEVIANCNNGRHYQVDPAKIPSDQNLEQNQQNFRDLLLKCIHNIIGAREEMPIGLIRESKMIYKHVADKYGDFANQILSGFLFLRFLLPAFSVPKLVGLPELLPPEPRQALLLVSTVLMVSTLRGQLNDKGAHLIPFNDIAQSAHDQFAVFFSEIVATNVGNRKDDLSFNEARVNMVLHQELWPLLKQIGNAASDEELSKDVKNDAENLINIVQSMGEPASAKKNIQRRTTFISGKAGNEMFQEYFETLMTTQFSEEVLCQLQDFIKKDEKKAPDGSTIFYLYFEKLAQIKNPMAMPYMLFKALQEDSITYATLVLILRDFDETTIPPPSDIDILAKMPPVYKIKRVICLETEPAYVQFILQNPSVINHRQHIFPENVELLVPLIGPISPLLPLSTLDSLSEPDSSHQAQLVIPNSNELPTKNVKMYQHSVQIVGPAETIGNCKVIPMNMLMINEIKFDKPIPNNDYIEFSLYVRDKDYRFRVLKTSPLYESIVLIVRRSQALQTLSSKVKIDTSTLQWLMLNLAFVNMVNEAVVPTVLKASLDLVYATFASFSFKRNIIVRKVPSEALPRNLVGYVQQLSEDIAENNPESFSGFLSEYFKVFNYVSMSSKPYTFLYLKPWIHLYANDIDNQPNITDNFLKAFSECIDASEVFQQCIWPGILKAGEKSVESFLMRIFDLRKSHFLIIIAGFAAIDSKLVTKFLLETLLDQCIENNDAHITFVCKSLAALFSCRLFDDAQIITFIEKMLLIRVKMSFNILSKCIHCFTNSLHYLISCCSPQPIHSDSRIDFVAAAADFANSPNKENRLFYVNCRNVAHYYRLALNGYPDKSVLNHLYQKFYHDLNNNSTSIIYSSVFVQNENCNELLKNLIKFAIEKSHDDDILSDISMALTNVMTFIYESNSQNHDDLSSKIFILAVAFCLRLSNSVPTDLLCQSIIHLNEQNLINNYSNQLSKIESETGTLPLCFSNDPLFSAFVILSALSDYPPSSDKINEMFINVMSQKKKCLTATASVLLALRFFDSNYNLVSLFESKVKESQNDIVLLFKAIDSETKRKLLNNKSPVVLATSVRALKATLNGNKMISGLPSFILPYFSELEKQESKSTISQIKIESNQFVSLIESIAL